MWLRNRGAEGSVTAGEKWVRCGYIYPFSEALADLRMAIAALERRLGSR